MHVRVYVHPQTRVHARARARTLTRKMVMTHSENVFVQETASKILDNFIWFYCETKDQDVGF